MSTTAKAVDTPAKNPKPELKVIGAPSNLPPLEERLHKLNQLFHLQTKYNKLQDSLTKLSEFEIKKDGERSRISISDDNRNDFSTYNPEIIQEVTDFLKERIKLKIKAIEPLLNW